MNLIDYGFVKKTTKIIKANYDDFKTYNTTQYTDKKQYKEDVKFGYKNENDIQKKLEEIVKKPIHKYKNKYSTFDFYLGEINNPTLNIELKSRRNDITAYPTQLIGCNKIDKGRVIKKKNENYKTLLVFKLTNGIYYWYDDGRPLKSVMRGNFVRGQKPCELYLIPNELLTLFEPSSP